MHTHEDFQKKNTTPNFVNPLNDIAIPVWTFEQDFVKCHRYILFESDIHSFMCLFIHIFLSNSDLAQVRFMR